MFPWWFDLTTHGAGRPVDMGMPGTVAGIVLTVFFGWIILDTLRGRRGNR